MTAEDGRRILLPTVADTRDFGERLAGVMRPGDLVLLTGRLGAGKTALTQGIGRGLEVTSPIVSPTFVISRVHGDGRIPLVHVDAYRLNSLDEVDELDLDITFAESVTVVEWGMGMADRLSDAHLEIRLTRLEDDSRIADLVPSGEDWANRLAAHAL